MISHNITVDEVALAEAVSLFEFVGGNMSDAIRIAINKTAPKIKTLASSQIRSQVRLSAAYVRDRLTIKRATRSKLSGAIGTPSRGLLLTRFSTDANIAGDKTSWIRPPLIPAGGIKLKIKPGGPTKNAPGIGANKPFYIRLNGGQNIGIAARTGPGRSKLKVFSGPSLSQVFDDVRDDVLPAASAEYQAQIADAMRYILAKKHPPEPTE